jgi:hypothetical protein
MFVVSGSVNNNTAMLHLFIPMAKTILAECLRGNIDVEAMVRRVIAHTDISGFADEQIGQGGPVNPEVLALRERARDRNQRDQDTPGMVAYRQLARDVVNAVFPPPNGFRERRTFEEYMAPERVVAIYPTTEERKGGLPHLISSRVLQWLVG